MDIPNAFIGRRDQPSGEEVLGVLDRSATQWTKLIEEMATCFGVATPVWKSVSPKYGWSLRLLLKKRTILYMSPCQGCFRVIFILGDKAVKAVRHSELPPEIIKDIDGATRYVEGTGVRLMVKTAKDLAPIRQLVEIKLAN